jgi:threonine dehydrogenase-like Zn-dependent dehydrogenase
MRVTTLHEPGRITVEDGPDPQIQAPTDAIVRVTAACICGSDLWPYRGLNGEVTPGPIGHEAVGVVEAVGDDVRRVQVGDFVIAPFCHGCGHCPECSAGITSACRNGGFMSGAQAELVRVQQADGSLAVIDGGQPDEALIPSLLTLSDVMATGWHAAVAAGVQPGHTAVVVGDGAVGLCGVLAAREHGADRIVLMSRHEDRQAIGRAFGATDVVAERGKAGEQAVRDLTDGVGADAVLECVGTEESMKTAFKVARAGATVGFVGVPNSAKAPIGLMFGRNIALAGGVAPVPTYLPTLVPMVLDGRIDPGRVFDTVLALDEAAEGYRRMDERESIKVLLRP